MEVSQNTTLGDPKCMSVYTHISYSYSLNSFEGIHRGLYRVDTIGLLKVDVCICIYIYIHG